MDKVNKAQIQFIEKGKSIKNKDINAKFESVNQNEKNNSYFPNDKEGKKTISLDKERKKVFYNLNEIKEESISDAKNIYCPNCKSLGNCKRTIQKVKISLVNSNKEDKDLELK